MGRWLVVRVVAWGLRGGVCDEHLAEILTRRFRHRNADWRAAILNLAKIHNARRLLRA